MTTSTKPHFSPVVKAAVLSIMLLQYMQALTSPALGAILKAFPQYSSLVIKQIQTIPTLVMIISTIAIIPLVRKMRKKTVLKLALALIFVGGILPAFGPDSMPFILGCRVIFGFGYGMVYALSSSFVIDLFEGDEQRKMLGWKSASGAVGGFLFQTIGGILAAIYWKYAFLGFLMALPFIALILWKCPDPSSLETQSKGAEKPKAPVTKSHLFVIILGLLNVMVYSCFMINMPIVIMTQKLGTPTTVALVMNFFTLGIFLGSFFFGWTSKIMKRYDLAITVLIYGIVLVVLTNFISLTTYIICALVFGWAFGTYNPALVLTVSRQGNPLAATSAIALFVAGQGLGQFLQPYFYLIGNAIGLQSYGELAPWVMAGPLEIVIAIGIFIWVTKVTNKKFPYSTQTTSE